MFKVNANQSFTKTRIISDVIAETGLRSISNTMDNFSQTEFDDAVIDRAVAVTQYATDPAIVVPDEVTISVIRPPVMPVHLMTVAEIQDWMDTVEVTQSPSLSQMIRLQTLLCVRI